MKKAYIAITAIAAIPALLFPMFGGTDIHFHRKSSGNKIRVACVGDSITNGALIPGCFFSSYPSHLGRMLGNGYHVENFGLNNRTLQSTGDIPYCKEKEYRRSLSFLPDIVVVMLGTNDTRDCNWKSVETFVNEYVSFLRAYQELPSSPEIILCLPPWSINADNFIKSLTNNTDANHISEINKGIQLVAEKLQLPIVNLYSCFQNNPSLLSYDGVHPNPNGALLIASKVATAILKNR